MPRRPASRQSSAVTGDGADSSRPRAERATYRDVDHPTSPLSPSMLAERHPCRSRIASAFPSSGTYTSEVHLEGDKIVSRMDR